MSDRQTLAEHGTALCLAAMGLAAGGGFLAAAIPVAILTAFGLDKWKACDTATINAARNAALDALRATGEISDADASSAASYLKRARKRIDFKPTRMIEAVKSGDLPGALLKQVFGTSLDSEDPGTIRAVSTTLEAAFTQLRKNDQYREVFTQEVVLDLLASKQREIKILQRIETKIDNMGEALENLAKANRDLLEALAARFGIADAFDMPDDAIRAALEEKAKDYRALKREVDAIDPAMQRLSNLKAAAQDALDRGDLEEVEERLNDVQASELEEAAKTAELRADNALLRGRVDDAYRILSAAADSFASVDPHEPIERRHIYMQKLYYHGLRFGGYGLDSSIAMIRDALTMLDKGEDALRWAMCQNALAIALSDQAIRAEGASRATLLAEAVTAYRDALTVRTREDHPVDWALIQNNLGNALQNQATRTEGEAGTALLAQAVAAYRDALTVYTREAHAGDWATTQNNLGAALDDQAIRTEGEAGTALLEEAVVAYRDALTVRTREEHPVDWAMTQNNLGVTLKNQATRTKGEAGAALLAEAVAAYRDALTVYTREEHPVDWAMTQNNLAAALKYQATRTEGEAGAALFAQAVAAYRDALIVYTSGHHPVQWAATRENLARLERARAAHDSTEDPRPHLDAALAHLDAALTVFDPEHMSYNHAKATGFRNDILAKLEALD